MLILPLKISFPPRFAPFDTLSTIFPSVFSVDPSHDPSVIPDGKIPTDAVHEILSRPLYPENGISKRV